MINLGRDSFSKHVLRERKGHQGGRELYICLWIVEVSRSLVFVSCWFILFFLLPDFMAQCFGLCTLVRLLCKAPSNASWSFILLFFIFLWDQESLYNSQWTVEIRGYCVNKTLHLFAFHYVRTMYKSVILYHNIKLGMFRLWLGIKLILKSFWRIGSSEHVQQRLSRPWDQGNNFLDHQICKRPWWYPKNSDQREVFKQ